MFPRFFATFARALRHFCVVFARWTYFMDEKFKSILESLPALPARSSREPYRELIEELRRRGRKYQDIADILATRCGIRIALSTIYRFLRKRGLTKAQVSPRPIAETRKADPNERIASSNSRAGKTPTCNEVQQRIAALKRKSAPSPPPPDVFHYDPNEPLHLPTKSDKSRTGE